MSDKSKQVIGISASKIIGGADVIFHSIFRSIKFERILILNSILQNEVRDTNSHTLFIKFQPIQKELRSIFSFCVRYISSARKLFQAIAKQDIVIANDFLALLYIFPLKVRYNTTVLFYCHSAFKNNFYNQNILSRYINLVSTEVIVPSNFLKNQLISIGVKPKSVSVIYNGVDDLQPDTHPAKNADKIRIGLLGDIVELKGQDVFVKAISDLKLKHQNIEAILLGRIKDQNYFKNKIEPYIKDETVKYGGSVSRQEAINSMSKCSIIVCTSKHSEVLPTVLIEAMCLGKVVVGTNIGGIPEIIKHEWNGFLIEPDSADSLTKAIDRIIAENLFEPLGSRARIHFEANFDKDRFIGNVERLIKNYY